MPNALAHTLTGAGAGLAAASLGRGESDPDASPAEVPLVALTGACVGRLPDILEPAIHPGHRAFFHSWTVALAVGCGVHRAYHWEPSDDLERALRWVALVGGAAYLIHLALDAATPKSLPTV